MSLRKYDLAGIGVRTGIEADDYWAVQMVHGNLRLSSIKGSGIKQTTLERENQEMT